MYLRILQNRMSNLLVSSRVFWFNQRARRNEWAVKCLVRKCIFIFSERSNFTLLFRIGRRSNVQRFITHVHSHTFAHWTFCLVTFSLLFLSWLLKFSTKGMWPMVFTFYLQEGVLSALVNLSETESNTSREMISRYHYFLYDIFSI